MKYCLLAIVLLFFYSCATNSKIGNSYSLGLSAIKFDTINKRFSILERGELSFHAYSEGSYIKAGQYIYLKSETKDSCIKYETIPGNVKGQLQLNCINFDERVPVIYNLNGQTIYSSQSGLSKFEYIQENEANVSIKVPFPKMYAGSCYNKFDTLYSNIVLDSKLVKEKGVQIKFSINYNYFNWISLTDTLELIDKHTLKSHKSGYSYVKDKVLENETGVNYLSRCMLPLSSNFK